MSPQRLGIVPAVALLATLLSPATALASGSFALPFDEITAVGRGFSGAETDGQSPGAIGRNPAVAAGRRNNGATFGGTLVYYGTRFQGSATREATDGSGIAGGNGGNPGRLDIPLPEMAWTHRLNDRWVGGLYFGAPYGITLRYDRNWLGRYHAVDSIIRGPEIVPSLAFSLNDRVNVGAGLRLQGFDVEFTNDVDLGARIQRDTTRQAGSDITTPACNAAMEPTLPGKYDFYNRFFERRIAFGWLVGLTWAPRDRTTVGLAFRSAVVHDLEGDALRNRDGWNGDDLRNDPCLAPVRAALGPAAFEEQVVEPALAASSDTGFQARMTLPETITLGVRQPWGDVELTATLRWARWSRFDAITFRFDNGAAAVTEPLSFDDSWFIGGGAQWSPRDRWVLRVGAAHETSTVSATTRSARAPDGHRNYVTTGLSYQLRPGLHIDFAAGYAYVGRRSVADITEAAATGNVLNGEFEPLHLLFSSSRLRWEFL